MRNVAWSRGRAWVFVWTLLTVAGAVIALPLSAAMLSSSLTRVGFLLPVGIGVGVAQIAALQLRERSRANMRWGLASAVGWTLGGLLASLFSSALSPFIIGAAFASAFALFGHAWALSAQIKQPMVWFMAELIVVIFAIFVAAVGFYALAPVYVWIIGWLVYGLLTGRAIEEWILAR